MTNFPIRKNKVVLSDYNYRRDIENRLLMADLTMFELEVLRELLNGSLKTSIKNLAQILDCSDSDLRAALTKFEKTKLFQINGDILTLCKEMRKYYETQIIKFEEDFEPNMEFIQGLLSKVPIHILPSWYAISRTSDHIFNSIVEKFFQTPRIYERHLAELNLDDPILNSMARDIHASKELKIHASELSAKYKLAREKFEEYMLLLEFNFVGYLSYSRAGDNWEEVITPFHEWSEYVKFLQETTPNSIKDTKKIKRNHNEDFGFLLELNTLLEQIKAKPLNMGAKHCDCPYIQKMTQLKLVEARSKQIVALDLANEWSKMSLADQAITLYRHPLNRLNISEKYSERDIREVEKGLKRVAGHGWVLFDDFKKGLINPIGSCEPVVLKSRGKRWKFMLPTYSEEDVDLIEKTIFKRLYETGMVATGSYQGQPCFCVTPFGKVAIID